MDRRDISPQAATTPTRETDPHRVRDHNDGSRLSGGINPGLNQSLSRPKADVRGPVTQSAGKAATRLSEDQISQLVREYMDGDQVSALAARYGIHRVTVSARLRRRNVPTRIKGLPSEAEVSAVLYKEGYSRASIGKHFGVTANTVRNTLLNSGTRLRGPNDVHRGAVPTMWLSTQACKRMVGTVKAVGREHHRLHWRRHAVTRKGCSSPAAPVVSRPRLPGVTSMGSPYQVRPSGKSTGFHSSAEWSGSKMRYPPA